MNDFQIVIRDYIIKSTGVDGGHHYISAQIDYNGQKRNITVYLKHKAEEFNLQENKQLTFVGNLLDQGEQQDLSLLEAKLTGVENCS